MIALLVGRFHAVTRAQATWIASLKVDRIVCALTSSDHARTRRNPLPVEWREELLRPALAAAGKPFDIVRVPDVAETRAWAPHVIATVSRALGVTLLPQPERVREGGGPGAKPLETAEVRVFTSNRDVDALFAAAGWEVVSAEVAGATPHEVVQRAADGRPWRDLATPETAAVWDRHGVPAMLRELFGQRLLNDDGELGHARDFASYGTMMDAALPQKLADIVPHVRPGRVVDKGCGTGALLVALAERFPQSAFVGVELSREFLRRCDENHYASQDVTLLFGDARDELLPRGSATTAVFSSVMHEVYSYSGYDRSQIAKALASAAAELGPGGRLIVRDGVSPGEATWRMRLLDDATRERFAIFAREFKHGQGAPFERLGDDRVRLSAHLANEFLCKKDYVKNWHIEVHEEFGALTVDGWREALGAAGLVVREARGYVNGWIEAHRYRGTVELTDDDDRPLPFPATNVVAVGEKP